MIDLEEFIWEVELGLPISFFFDKYNLKESVGRFLKEEVGDERTKKIFYRRGRNRLKLSQNELNRISKGRISQMGEESQCIHVCEFEKSLHGGIFRSIEDFRSKRSEDYFRFFSEYVRNRH